MKTSTLNTLDKAVQRRVRFEEQVIRDIVKAVLPNVVHFRVFDGEEYSKPLTTWTQVKNEIHACDEEYLIIRFKPNTFGEMTDTETARLYLVYGNEGWDVVCDWSYHNDKVYEYLDPIISKASDRAERGL